MKPEPQPSPDEIERAAAEWIIRLDRGLTAAEQDEYSEWVTIDARHREAITRMRWGWEELDRLAGLEASELSSPDPDLLSPARRGMRRQKVTWLAPFVLALAAAAAITVVFQLRKPEVDHTAGPDVAQARDIGAPGYERRTLADGSVVELNRGATIAVEFTPTERHIHLAHGEANFTVVKNPARPFTVEAAGVTVQAVGTVFNVRMESAAVDVLVSEGTVKVGQGSANRSGTSAPAEPVFVKAGQRALVSLSPHAPPPQVTDVSASEIGELLAWQPQMLDFDDAPLSQIVAAFNAHNATKLVIGDPALNRTSLTVAFRSDNVEGFVRLLDSNFEIRAERRGAHEIVLLKK